MSLIMSFDWTTPALLAEEKTVSRRHWKDRHAQKYRKGMRVQAWDHQPRTRKGQHKAWIRLREAPYKQPLCYMPDSDWVAEGFRYMDQHRELLPANCPIDPSWEGFVAWRSSPEEVYVVRFDLDALVDPASRVWQIPLEI